MKFQKGFASIILEIAVVAILLGAFIYASPKFKNSPQPSSIPAASPSPSEKTANWKTYQLGEKIKDFGFSITYPREWKIKYKEEGLLSYGGYRINFDVSPPEWGIDKELEDWNGWRIMSVDIYPAKTNINSWITAFLPEFQNKLLIENKKIGNKHAYLLKGKSEPSKEIDAAASFAPRYVVLVKEHSYAIGFNDNGQPGSDKKIQDDIFPTFKFLDDNQTVCAQVITPARNQTTGECKQFPTPCDVPEGWTKVSRC